MFELFFFTGFVKDVIISKTNMHLTVHCELSYGKFLWWIGIWLLMSTLHGLDHATFWALLEINHFQGVLWRLTNLMSQNWLNAILCAIFYTNHDKLAYRDKFWEVQQMVDEWNKNMAEQFTPSSASCLDESMNP